MFLFDFIWDIFEVQLAIFKSHPFRSHFEQNKKPWPYIR